MLENRIIQNVSMQFAEDNQQLALVTSAYLFPLFKTHHFLKSRNSSFD